METAAAATAVTNPTASSGAITAGGPATATLAGPSIEKLEVLLDVTYTWGYEETRAQLRDLYQKLTREERE